MTGGTFMSRRRHLSFNLMNGSRLARRGLFAFFFTLVLLRCTAESNSSSAQPPPRSNECEWCGAQDAPERLSHSTTIAPASEPGTRIVITGRILHADGSPARNVLMYAYHTNAKGIYPKRGPSDGTLSWRHGYLRGWLRTDREGRYELKTIRPGSYPGRSDPAHIHVTLKPPDGDEFYIPDFIFDDDPLVTATERERLAGVGESAAILRLRQQGSTLHASRDIVIR